MFTAAPNKPTAQLKLEKLCKQESWHSICDLTTLFGSVRY